MTIKLHTDSLRLSHNKFSCSSVGFDFEKTFDQKLEYIKKIFNLTLEESLSLSSVLKRSESSLLFVVWGSLFSGDVDNRRVFGRNPLLVLFE